MNWNEYTLGVRRGMPVGMGYLSVSFGFGSLGVCGGLRVWGAGVVSCGCSSAGGVVSFSGVGVVMVGGLEGGELAG